MSEPDLESYWRRLGHPSTVCSQCGRGLNPDDSSPIFWRCEVCGHLVCRACALTKPIALRRSETEGVYRMPMRWGHPPTLYVANDQNIATFNDENGVAEVGALRGGDEYLEATLCSADCWETAGRPFE